MNVIAAKKVTDLACQWLCSHGAEIEHSHNLSIVFLPSSLRIWRSDSRHYPHYIEDESGRHAILIENGCNDSERTIYTLHDEGAL